MPNIRPFYTPEPSRLVELLNKPSYLERTFAVSLADARTGGSGYWGNVGVDVVGGISLDYIAGMRGSATLITGILSTNVARFVPFVPRSGFRIAQMGMSVQASAANSTIRIGIYDSKDDENGDLTPYRRVYGSSELSGASTGAKSATGLTLDLDPDRVYWAVYLCGTGTPTIWTVPVTNVDGMLGASLGNPPTLTTCLTSPFTYAALPATWDAACTASSISPPAIFLTYTRPSGYATTRTLPCTTITRDGWLLQRARFVKCSNQDKTASARPYASVKARVRNGSKIDVLGTYSTASLAASAGEAITLTGTSDLQRRLATGTVLEAEVTQSGWPRVSLDDAMLEFDLTYAGA